MEALKQIWAAEVIKAESNEGTLMACSSATID
jgi:hypothetical protein